MENKLYRSPLFYVGDKYKLIDEINSHFNKESKVILQILFIYKAKKYLFKT